MLVKRFEGKGGVLEFHKTDKGVVIRNVVGGRVSDIVLPEKEVKLVDGSLVFMDEKTKLGEMGVNLLVRDVGLSEVRTDRDYKKVFFRFREIMPVGSDLEWVGQ